MKTKTFSILIQILFVLTIVSCSNSTADQSNAGTGKIVEPIDYGNGVYYFACSQSVFGNSLSSFIKDNNNMELVAITLDPNSSQYNSVWGYFVVFREKPFNGKVEKEFKGVN